MKPKFIETNGKNKWGQIIWIVECPYCLKKYSSIASHIRGGKSTKCVSCARKMQTKGGKRKHKCKDKKLYNMWRNMQTRCYGNNKSITKSYKEKGVSVCQEWLDSFDEFAEWALLNGYKEGLEIDKDKLCEEKNIYPKTYSPSTCLFMTKKENCKYRDNSFHNSYKRPSKITLEEKDKMFKYREQGKTQLEIADIMGYKRALVSHVLNGRIKNFSK